MTIDEETLRLYAEMQAAARDGNLLSYANNLARSMASGRMSVPAREAASVQREEPRHVPVRERSPTPQSESGRNGTPNSDRVRVSNL